VDKAQGLLRRFCSPAACAAGWILTIVAIAAWLSGASDGALRDQLRRWQFWVLETQFLLIAIGTGIALPSFVRSLKLSRRDLVLPTVASVLALVLTTAVAPRTNRIYYDEHIYQGVAQNLSDLRLAQMCLDGNVEYGVLQCRTGEYSKEPYGYPYVLSLAYRLVGTRESVGFALNAAAAPVAAWVVFLLGTALAGARAGGYGSLIVALTPELLRWSHTAAAEPLAALACAFAVLASIAFAREPSVRTLFWTMAATVFAIQFRTESVLIVPIVAAVILLYAPRELGRLRAWWAGLAALVLSAPHVAHVYAVRHEPWGAMGARLSLEYLRANLRANGMFYLGDTRFPVLFTVLAVIAVIAYRPRRAVVVPALHFVLFWGLFLFFYAGSYNYGADDRFSLISALPLAVVSGMGGAWLTEQVTRIGGVSMRRANAAFAAVLLVQFSWYLPFVRMIGEGAWAARADVQFAREVSETLPANSIVLTHNPHMFQLWGLNAAQMSIVSTNPTYITDTLARSYAGGVFLHWNYWCNTQDKLQRSFCSTALDRFPHEVLREYRVRDYRYVFYRLDASGGSIGRTLR
jgi:hypothetical protein